MGHKGLHKLFAKLRNQRRHKNKSCSTRLPLALAIRFSLPVVSADQSKLKISFKLIPIEGSCDSTPSPCVPSQPHTSSPLSLCRCRSHQRITNNSTLGTQPHQLVVAWGRDIAGGVTFSTHTCSIRPTFDNKREAFVLFSNLEFLNPIKFNNHCLICLPAGLQERDTVGRIDPGHVPHTAQVKGLSMIQ